jgi:TrmH family RNA methyltransferase
MKRFLSRQALADLRALQDKAGRNAQNAFLIEGFKLVQEALQAQFPLQAIYFAGELPESIKVVLEQTSRVQPIPVLPISLSEISQITRMPHPEGILAVGTMSPCLAAQQEYAFPAIYLWEINDPGNLGTIIRTAAWYGIRQIWLSPGSVDPFNLKVVRGAMGALFQVKLRREFSAAQLLDLVEHQHICLAVAEKEGGVAEMELSEPWVLAFGSESHGVPAAIREAAQYVMSIPRYGYGESLNLGIAVGIILDRISRKRDR